MPRVHVQLSSTALRSCAYDGETQALDVTFASGRVFTYEGVPQDVFEGLRDAPSPGSYYHANIKDAY